MKLLKIGLVGLAALALSSSLTQSVAQGRFDFSGTYAVEGKNPDTSAYKGMMSIVPYGDGYRIKQTYGADSFEGIGNDFADYLAASFVVADQPQVLIYQITAANTLTGYWQDYKNKTEGSETAMHSNARAFGRIPVAAVDNTWDYKGNYRITGTNTDGSSYTGSMILSAYGDGYRASFSSGGTVWRGIGSYIGNYLALAWNFNGVASVTIYAGDPNTGTLSGYWQNYDEPKEGTETATRR